MAGEAGRTIAGKRLGQAALAVAGQDQTSTQGLEQQEPQTLVVEAVVVARAEQAEQVALG